MRAIFEKILPDHGASWTFEQRILADGIPFEWHYHPEYELTLTLNSEGFRYVGGDVEPYGDGDLVLIGPCLAHSWCSNTSVRPGNAHQVMVIKFSQEWAQSLTGLFPEFNAIEELLRSSARGIAFGPEARTAARPLIEAMPLAQPAERLLLLLRVLSLICRDQHHQLMANAAPGSEPNETDLRILRVLDHLHKHFSQQQSVPELADIACVSISTFHRLFRRHTRMTVTEYLVRLRIGRACAMLMQQELSVATVAADAGYFNLSLFNRQFSQLKGETPSQFRKRHRRPA